MSPDPPPSRYAAGLRVPPFAWRLVFELVVVFVGVYAAFAMSEWEARREAEERQAQIREALAREIEDITRNTRGAAEWSAGQLAFYDSAFAAGGTPPLSPMIEPVRVRPHMWEASLQSGGLELMDVRTMFRVSQFYNDLNAGFEQLEQLRELSETLLLPNLDRDSGEFYASGGELRPKYRWYILGLRHLNELARRITERGDALVASFDATGVVDDEGMARGAP